MDRGPISCSSGRLNDVMKTLSTKVKIIPIRSFHRGVRLLRALGPVMGAVLGAALLMRYTRPTDTEIEVKRIPAHEAETLDLYRGEIRGPDQWTDRDPAEGRRYRVWIEDESRSGAAGIARIGGVLTFVDAAEPGDDVVVEITRRNPTTAGAIVVRRLSPAAITPIPGDSATADDVRPGAVFVVEISERDRQHPDRDGVARIGALVLFVPRTQPGDQARVRIVERGDRWARAEHFPLEP